MHDVFRSSATFFPWFFLDIFDYLFIFVLEFIFSTFLCRQMWFTVFLERVFDHRILSLNSYFLLFTLLVCRVFIGFFFLLLDIPCSLFWKYFVVLIMFLLSFLRLFICMHILSSELLFLSFSKISDFEIISRSFLFFFFFIYFSWILWLILCFSFT